MKQIAYSLLTVLLLLGVCQLHGEDVDSVDMHGNTSLHLAALQGRAKDVARLIEAGADVVAKDQGGQTPLHEAAKNLHVGTIQLLIDKGADVNSKDELGRTALFEAARGGGLEAVKLLVASGAHIPKAGITPLNEAAGGNFHSRLNADERRMSLVKFFLDQGVDVNAMGSSAWAMGGGDCTPLHAASARAGANVLSLLLESGAEIEAKDRMGATPLIHAALGGNSEAAAFLVEKEAEVNAKDSMGRTPLHAAVSQNNFSECNPEVVKILLKAGADPNARANTSYTPLHIAVAWGWDDPEILRMLLEAGANINAKDRSGRTPRSLAEEKPEILKQLEMWEEENRTHLENGKNKGQ